METTPMTKTEQAENFARGYLRRAPEGTTIKVPGGLFVKLDTGIAFVSDADMEAAS